MNSILLIKITLIFRLAVVLQCFSVLCLLQISLLHMFQKFKLLPSDILNVLVFLYFLKISLHVLSEILILAFSHSPCFSVFIFLSNLMVLKRAIKFLNCTWANYPWTFQWSINCRNIFHGYKYLERYKY